MSIRRNISHAEGDTLNLKLEIPGLVDPTLHKFAPPDALSGVPSVRCEVEGGTVPLQELDIRSSLLPSKCRLSSLIQQLRSSLIEN